MNLQFAIPASRDFKVPADLRPLLADLFVFYIKTTNLHWYLSRGDFAGCGQLLEQHTLEIRGLTQAIAERARAAGSGAFRSLCGTVDSGRFRRIDYPEPEHHDRLSALRSLNRRLAQLLRFAHGVVYAEQDIKAAKLIEGWIDETECRNWLLLKTLFENSCRDFAPLSEMRQDS